MSTNDLPFEEVPRPADEWAVSEDGSGVSYVVGPGGQRIGPFRDYTAAYRYIDRVAGSKPAGD
jgi:hypothetical protein